MKPHELPYEPIPPKNKHPLYAVIALVVAIALFVLSVEGYFWLIRPEPGLVPALADIQSFLPQNPGQPFLFYKPDDVRRMVADTQDAIKLVANFIAAQSCSKADSVCQSKALFYFVRDNIQYVADAQFHDRLENPLITLKTGGADCEDMAVLLGALEKAIGNDARLVFIPGHAYIQVRVPDYRNKWYSLEVTCKTCKWNQVPDENALQKKTFEEL
ncbi:transglutaminase domain-containing protein [Candidatus Peregrinibacteria bacterium]|nr:transglutaminase domain-containing protein [Candidatus Peregrinibacteria bacterium]